MTRRVLRRELEAPIEKRVAEDARTLLGVPSLKLNVRGRRAWPDRLFILPAGRVKFVEFKVPGELPGELQEHVHTILRGLGHDVEVHDTYDGAMASIAGAAAIGRKKGRYGNA